MIAPRFLPLLCVLTAFALVPTIIHGYAGLTTVDGLRTATIPTRLAGLSSVPGERNAGWGKRRFDSDDWFQRRYSDGRRTLVVSVIRSYDLKKLYHHPELDVAYGTGFTRAETRTFAAHPDIPVHVLYAEGDEPSTALYALHYGDRFIGDPIRFQIRTAGELLLRGRRQMTLFFVHDLSASAEPLDGQPAAAVLFDAIQQFVAAGDTAGR
jgi:hypothetical protein